MFISSTDGVSLQCWCRLDRVSKHIKHGIAPAGNEHGRNPYKVAGSVLRTEVKTESGSNVPPSPACIQVINEANNYSEAWNKYRHIVCHQREFAKFASQETAKVDA